MLSNTTNHGRWGWWVKKKIKKWKICKSWRCLSQWNQRHFKASSRRGDSPSRAIWKQSVWIVKVLLVAMVPVFMSVALNVLKQGCTRGEEVSAWKPIENSWVAVLGTGLDNPPKKIFGLHIKFLTFKLTTELSVDCLNDLLCCPCSQLPSEHLHFHRPALKKSISINQVTNSHLTSHQSQ